MFGFKKRPENDIWQYHVVTMVTGSEKTIHEVNMYSSVTKVFDDFPISFPYKGNTKGEALGGGKRNKFISLTVKQACKFFKKHKLILQVNSDFEVFQYIKDHLPRELWEYDIHTKYAKFN